MTKRTNILRALGGTTWGWRPVDLRKIYIATQRSLAEYGSQAWAPWLSKSNLGKLESAQLNAARAITGYLRSTPAEFVLSEAHFTPLESKFKALSLLKADSCLQQAKTDLRRLTPHLTGKQSPTSVDPVRKRSNQPNTSGSDAQPSQRPASDTISEPPMMNSCAFHSQL